MEFSTFDKDNDESYHNCAVYYNGANWWNRCGSNNINGEYGDIGHQFMWWRYFDNNNYYMALKSMTLMFRQAD